MVRPLQAIRSIDAQIAQLEAAREDAVRQLHMRLAEVATVVRTIQGQVDAAAQNHDFRHVLREEQNWLDRSGRMIADVRMFREEEMRPFWPAVRRRWVFAVAFALAAAIAAGAGYIWASRPYDTELVSLRTRVELLDAVAARLLRMTPAERRQFDSLMKWNVSRNR